MLSILEEKIAFWWFKINVILMLYIGLKQLIYSIYSLLTEIISIFGINEPQMLLKKGSWYIFFTPIERGSVVMHKIIDMTVSFWQNSSDNFNRFLEMV